jgi:hypothetical protein
VADESEPELDQKTKDQWIAGICAFTGLWGILTGFAVFILIRTGDFANPLTFVLGLCVAAAASFVVETLRESVRGEITVRPTRRLGPVLGTIVTLIVFELFILAVHNAVDIFGDADRVRDLRDALLGPVANANGNATIDLIVLAAIWLASGSIVGLALGLFILREKGARSFRERTVRGGLAGVAAAVVAAPALVFAYVLVWRLCLAVRLAFTDQATLAAHYSNIIVRLGESHVAGPGLLMLYAGIFVVFGFLELWLWSLVGKIVVIGLIVACIVIGKRAHEWRPLGVVLAGCAAGVIAPLFVDVGDVFRLALLAAVVWFVPGLVLGLATPMLEEPSDRARFWSTIAATLGAIVAALTILRWHELASRNVLLVALALAFFGVALLFTRFRDLREFWPALALCLATIAASLTFLLVSLTASFQGVLAEVATIDSLPASIVPTADTTKLASDITAISTSWYIRHPDEPPPVVDPYALALAFRDVDTLSRDDLVARIDAHSADVVALHRQAVAHLLAVAHSPSLPLPLSADVANDAAALERFASAFERYSDAHIDRDRIAHRDDRDWAKGASDVRIAVGRVLATDAVLADFANVARENASAEQHTDAERAFSMSEAPEQLEGSLAGSFAFWVTVGLLSAWAIRREETPHEESSSNEASADATSADAATDPASVPLPEPEGA